MKIFIVDDHVLFREGLVSLLQSQPDFSVVGEASSSQEAVEKISELEPDLVLMDISLPDKSGLETIRAIMAHNTDLKVVMLTVHESDDLLFKAIANGAKGYLLKNISSTKLLASLRALERGEAALSRTMTGRILDRLADITKTQLVVTQNGPATLTGREQEVYSLLLQGATNREIAERLTITLPTVKVHVHNVLKKLNLANRRELIQYVRRQRGDSPQS